MGMLLVGNTQYLAFEWPAGGQQPFVVHTGNHVLHPSVAVVVPQFGIERLKARRQDYRPYVYFYLLCLLTEIYSAVLTHYFANSAIPFFKITAAFINIGDQGNCLSEVYVDRFVLRYVLVELIRVMDRAELYTGSAAGAFALVNISRLFSQRYIEVPCLPCYTVNFSKGQDLYVGVPVDLDQFRREYSHRAVIGGEGLIKLSHMAAQGRPLLNEENLEPGVGKVKGGLNTADPSANDQHVAKVIVAKAFANLL